MKYITSILFLLAVLLLNGCIAETFDFDETGNGERGVVVFSIRMPNTKAGGSTRLSIHETERDTRIEQLDVLVFNSSDIYIDTFTFSNVSIDYGTDGSNIGTFQLQLMPDDYTMVIFANARTQVNTITRTKDATPKATILTAAENLQLSLGIEGAPADNVGAQWNIAASAIPMFGETAVKVESNAVIKATVNMTRMLAKIDLRLHPRVINADFTLVSAHIFNPQSAGRIVPATNPTTNPTDPTNAWVIEPTLAGTMRGQAGDNSIGSDRAHFPIVYNVDPSNTTNSILNTIYTFESENRNFRTQGGQWITDNTVLVVGVKHKDDEVTDPNRVHYYRVDFIETINGIEHFRSLLRNHRYEVEITELITPGMPTPELAFRSYPVHIEANVRGWDDGGKIDENIAGTFEFTISHGRVAIPSALNMSILTPQSRQVAFQASSSVEINVYTDYPSGWKLVGFFDGRDTNANPITWLEAIPAAGPTREITDILIRPRIIQAAENNTNAPRVVYMRLEAGNGAVTYNVEITQNPAMVNPSGHLGFAGSNIYWDPDFFGTGQGALTFVGVGQGQTPTANHSESMRGLTFQWGGLWGIGSTGQTHNSLTAPWSAGTVVYRLARVNGEWRHVRTTGATFHTMPALPTNVDAGLTVGEGVDETQAQQRQFLYEMTDINRGIGDICRVLTEIGSAPGAAQGHRWRMPTAAEIGPGAGAYLRENAGTIGNTAGHQTIANVTLDDGQFRVRNGGHTGAVGNRRGAWRGSGSTGNNARFFLPVAGINSWDQLPAGGMRRVGHIGNYWTASPQGVRNSGTQAQIDASIGRNFSRAIHMEIGTGWLPSTVRLFPTTVNATTASGNSTNNGRDGFSVRCVRYQ